MGGQSGLKPAAVGTLNKIEVLNDWEKILKKGGGVLKGVKFGCGVKVLFDVGDGFGSIVESDRGLADGALDCGWR